MMNIAYRVFSRYGQPRHCKEGNDKAFGELFQVSLGGTHTLCLQAARDQKRSPQSQAPQQRSPQEPNT